jgi:hypothetical protein
MSEFSMFFQLGVDHIADWQGYDHMLFLLALCARFSPRHWRRVVILVTAFTLGHSLSLAAAALGWVAVNASLVEFLIPLTILTTALANVLWPTTRRAGFSLSYTLAGGFGLIHGLGFSNYLRSLLGRQSDIITPLFGFNLGLEAGQLAIVAVIMALALLATQLAGRSHRDWNLFVSGSAAGLSILLISQNFYW